MGPLGALANRGDKGRCTKRQGLRYKAGIRVGMARGEAFAKRSTAAKSEGPPTGRGSATRTPNRPACLGHATAAPLERVLYLTLASTLAAYPSLVVSSPRRVETVSRHDRVPSVPALRNPGGGFRVSLPSSVRFVERWTLPAKPLWSRQSG